MKIGVSSYSFGAYRRATGCSYADLCRKAKEIGFDCIEFINLGGDEEAEAKTIRTTCDELGLEISAYTVGADLYGSETAVATLKHDIDIAALLGAPVLRHDVAYNLPEGVDWKDALEVIVPRIREVTEYAQSKGVRTCTENHGFIFQDSMRVKTLIDTVNHPNYRWLVDMGNFLCVDENPLDAVKVAAPYAIHAHAKDFIFRPAGSETPEAFICTRGKNFIRGTILGHGIVPLRACIETLQAAGYNGTLSLEFEGLEDNITALTMGYRRLREMTQPK